MKKKIFYKINILFTQKLSKINSKIVYAFHKELMK